jgi:putative ABC transport system permease protein
MRRVAIATLWHDAFRSLLLVVGLATAWGLVTVQIGLRRGFELSSRAILDHAGGDVWVVARGVKVIDDGEPVPAGSLADVVHPCITGKRPIIVDYTQVRRPDRSLVTVQIVGVDAASHDRIPWAVVAGKPEEIERDGIAGIDAADAEKLGLTSDGMGQEIHLRSGVVLRVNVVSRGARNFTQTPYLFIDVRTARQILSLPDDAATFWALDLREAGCAAEVSGKLRSDTLDAPTRGELALSTTTHWIDGSGIGALLTAGSFMAALVGAAALLQSTMTLVRTHTREIATVRALGARRGELAAFVAWQVGIVSILATVIGLGLAFGVSEVLQSTGLSVVVDLRSCLVGLCIAVLSTALAAIVGGRVLGRIDPREVLE